MDTSDKQEILDAIGTLSTRLGSMEGRMNGLEERMSGFAQEMRSGFENLDRRLVSLEEKVHGMEKSLDEILEGSVLGKKHITLTRPEYDTIVDTLHLPNRFREAH